MKKKDISSNILLFIALALFVARITNFLTINLIEGSSMVPTYHEGEIVVGSNFSKLTNSLEYLDVVTAQSPHGTPVIKRIIGKPNDIISIDASGNVYRNGEKLQEDYINEQMGNNSGNEIVKTFTLDENQYFICGDNRNHSSDSRIYGPINVDDIKSKILFRVFKKGG